MALVAKESPNYKVRARLLLHALREGRYVAELNDALVSSKAELEIDNTVYNNIIAQLHIGLESDKWISKIIDQLDHYTIRTYKVIEKYTCITMERLESLCDDKFSRYLSFIIFGCPSSTDTDVVVIVDKHSNGIPFPLFSSEEARLYKELDELKYNTSERDVDINLIAIENNAIIASSKGGPETQNMVMATYNYWVQKYECPNFTVVNVDIGDRLRAFSKYVLNYLSHIVDDYSLLRYKKQTVYMEGSDNIMIYVKELEHLFIKESGDKKWQDTMKAMVMKYTQMILIEKNIHVYTKDRIINEFRKFHPTLAEAVRWFLYRGKYGEFSAELIPSLHVEYCRIVDDYLAKFAHTSEETLKSDIMNPTMLSDELFFEFLKGPVHYTERFKELWVQTYKGFSVNEIFPIKSSDRNDIVPIIGEELASKFVFIDQRSPEWLTLLNFYECGKNSNNITDSFEGTFNLIRGAITELIIMNIFDSRTLGQKFTKCSVGFLVEDDKIEGSPGCAPDLLAVSEDEIVPIEIKTLRSGSINHDYYREITLATRQCVRARDILLSGETKVEINKKLMLIAHFTDSSLVIRSLVIDF